MKYTMYYCALQLKSRECFESCEGLPYFRYPQMCIPCGLVFEKVYTYDGCIFSILEAAIMGSFLEILPVPSLKVKNGHFPAK